MNTRKDYRLGELEGNNYVLSLRKKMYDLEPGQKWVSVFYVSEIQQNIPPVHESDTVKLEEWKEKLAESMVYESMPPTIGSVDRFAMFCYANKWDLFVFEDRLRVEIYADRVVSF